MKYVLVVLLAALVGCTVGRQAEYPTEQPELISISQLPPVATSAWVGGLKLNVLFHILADGTVDNVRLLGSSGDVGWDSSAIQAMEQWRFARPSQGAPLWVRQTVIVQVQQPVFMDLVELVYASQQVADSVYRAIENGASFDTIAVKGSASGITKFRAGVDIGVYPAAIRTTLLDLAEGELTHPIRLGEKYIIYMRMNSEALKQLMK